MIRSDYFLRMLAQFFEVLSRIRALQKGQKWSEAGLLADKEFEQLIGAGAEAAAQLSETELLARLIKSDSALAVKDKTLILAGLFKEAGDIAAGQKNGEQSRCFYLKGLHMLLGVLAREEIADFPEFLPNVEGFVNALGDFPLPITTQAMLMQHYERVGDFARAENMLYSMIEDQPDSPELLEFGISFYHRALRQTDDALITGNLPRAELESGLRQIYARKEAQK